jgi:RNA polymerase sigma-70 factor (ECF subfamily)
MNTDEPSDAELVARVRGGERGLYAELIRRHQSRLRTVLSYYFHSREEIEEHLQVAFVQAYLNLSSCDMSAGFYAWLRGVAINTLKMELRRLHTSRRWGAEYLRYLQLQKLENEEHAEPELRAEALKHCLAKLPTDDASLISAKYEQRRPLGELARQWQITTGALKVRLLRIRGVLRVCIQKQLRKSDEPEHGML